MCTPVHYSMCTSAESESRFGYHPVLAMVQVNIYFISHLQLFYIHASTSNNSAVGVDVSDKKLMLFHRQKDIIVQHLSTD